MLFWAGGATKSGADPNSFVSSDGGKRFSNCLRAASASHADTDFPAAALASLTFVSTSSGRCIVTGGISG
jgi:hypothetical protein